MLRRSISCSFLLTMLSCLSYGQLLTVDTDTYTPEQLVTEVLVTGCTEAFNVSYTGDPLSIGYFLASNTPLQFNQGIVLVSGNATMAIGPNNSSGAGSNNGQPGDPDLNNICSATTYNATILEFDFVPQSDTLQFNFIFGSEEYLEYVNAGFNDVFAFFLTGGPEGYNNQNIALVPGTSTPVSIDNVNSGTNSAYYINNGTGSTPNVNNSVQFDGLTTAMTAQAMVTSCETYHIKIAVADAGDGILDSGVFLEAHSFNTGGEVNFQHFASGTLSQDTYEGCTNYFVFERLDTTDLSDTLHVEVLITGTVNINSDLDNFDPTVIILPGEIYDTLFYSAFFDGIIEGQETLIITLLNGCPCGLTATDYVINIFDNHPLEPGISNDTTICIGESVLINSTINPNVNPASVSYLWNTTETSTAITVSPTQTTTYTVSVTGVCIESDETSMTVTVISDFDASFDSSSDSVCIDKPVTFSFNGTTDPLSTFNWEFTSGNPISATGQGPHTTVWSSAGIYNVTLLVDNNGCIGTDSTVIFVAPTPTFDTQMIEPLCYGDCTGSITMLPTGSFTPYSYQWDDPLSQVTETASGLCAGNYNSTVTNSMGCVSYFSGEMSQPAELPPINGQLTYDTLICYGETVSIFSSVNPALLPSQISYLWNTGATTSSITDSPSTSTTYTVTITRECYTVETISAYVTVIQMPDASFKAIEDSVCINEPTLFSHTGSAGSTANFNWTFNDGTPSTANTVGPHSVSWPATGNYNILLHIDDYGCTSDGTISVFVFPKPVISISATDALCFSSCDGTMTAQPVGIFTPYSYLWSDLAGQTSQVATDLCAGSYTVIVSDNNACTAIFSSSLGQPAVLMASATSTAINCFGEATGTATVSCSQGTSPYYYLWSDPTGQTSPTAFNLAYGPYNVSVTDAHGCKVLASTTVTQPNAPLSTTVAGVDVLCFNDFNGSVSVAPSGGTPPYQFNWTGSQQTASVNGLGPGTYYVTVVDVNGCKEINNQFVFEPALLTSQISATLPTCHEDNNGSLSVTASGGTVFSYTDYLYLWSNDYTLSYCAFAGLGDYSVTITDANNCKTTAEISITDPDELITAVSDDTIICIGTSAWLTSSATGGIPVYTYLWNTGSTSSNIHVSPTTETEYEVQITDANGCMKSKKVVVDLYPELELSVSPNHNPVCPGDPLDILAEYSGGTGWGYSVFLDGEPATPPITVYPPATTVYTVQVGNQCGQIEEEITVNTYDVPSPVFFTDVTNGCVPLTVHFSTSGTTEPGYIYIWDFHSDNSSYEKNPVNTFYDAGVYDITLSVISPEGCIITHTEEELINAYPLPDAYFITNVELTSILEPEISFENQTTGGSHYEWQFGDGDLSNEVNPVHSYTEAGEYNVLLIATSNHGCVDSIYYQVIINPEYTFYAPTAFTPGSGTGNEMFFVKGSGIEKETFELLIYDRWGEVIFKTKNIDEGWSGHVKGKGYASVGTYAWQASFRDLFGREHIENGPVTVIK